MAHHGWPRREDFGLLGTQKRHFKQRLCVMESTQKLWARPLFVPALKMRPCMEGRGSTRCLGRHSGEYFHTFAASAHTLQPPSFSLPSSSTLQRLSAVPVRFSHCSGGRQAPPQSKEHRGERTSGLEGEAQQKHGLSPPPARHFSR